MQEPANPAGPNQTGPTTGAPSPTGTATPGMVRPPEGFARGKVAVSPWVLVVLGLALVGGTVAFFILRHRRLRADTLADSIRPPSSMPPSSRSARR